LYVAAPSVASVAKASVDLVPCVVDSAADL
jgi:hypothetical protein